MKHELSDEQEKAVEKDIIKLSMLIMNLIGNYTIDTPHGESCIYVINLHMNAILISLHKIFDLYLELNDNKREKLINLLTFKKLIFDSIEAKCSTKILDIFFDENVNNENLH
jgi:hypothetical protein